MGMFDYVKYEALCSNCGFRLTEWQSKDGDCTLSLLNPSDVHRFYESCPNCHTWNEYHVKPLEIEIVSLKS